MPLRRKPLPLPEGVQVSPEAGGVSVKGPEGDLRVKIPLGIEVEKREGALFLKKKEEVSPAIFGLTSALLSNAIEGVSRGFTKELQLVGVGYRVEKVDEVLKFSLGFSHPVEFRVPEGITAEAEGSVKLKLGGIDKQLVSQTAARIRQLRPPEPYKGKGIRYAGESVRRKPGKAAKAIAGGAIGGGA